MILFSHAKINLGLQILRKRSDGFHDLQSVMYPVGLKDIIEIRIRASGEKALKFSQSGIKVDEESGKNLCEKAHELFAMERKLPPLEIHLHKQIPIGAGLGGGSSNASFILKGLNDFTSHPMETEQLHELAASLGSDCPFFLYEQAMLMEGRGELLSPSPVSLKGYWLVLLFPGIHISTAEAYAGVKPVIPETPLARLTEAPLADWRGSVVNDFEEGIFEKHPELAYIKAELYNSGAIYASLSGSGSSLYGIFKRPLTLPGVLAEYVIWKGEA